MRLPLLIAAVVALGLAPAAEASAHCGNVLPDGRVIVRGPLVDEFGRPCQGTFVRPPVIERRIPAPSVPHTGFTTGEIGPFTTGEIGPFTTFSNSVPPANSPVVQPHVFRRR
jgi:hypothetical protein